MSRPGAPVIALLVLAACPRQPGPVAVGRVLVDAALGGDGVQLDKEDVRGALQQQLAAERRGARLVWADQGTAVLRARAMGGRVPPGPTGNPLVVLRLQLDWRNAAQRTELLEVTVEQRASSAGEHPDALVTQAVRTGLHRLEQQVALGERSTAEIVAALQDEDRELRRRAIQLLGQRKDPGTLDALVALFDDPDEALVLRAVGAVVALGDQRGVHALTDLTHRKSPTFVRQIVYAVAAIGGREAEAYLFTVASGHPDEGVQQAARQAMAELAARGPTPLAGGDVEEKR